MIVECSRRPDGWIPVYGNEEEICEFLLKHDFYKNFLIEKANDNFKFFHKNIPLGGYYYNYGEDYFDNEDDFFVKLNEDGSITISYLPKNSDGSNGVIFTNTYYSYYTENLQ